MNLALLRRPDWLSILTMLALLGIGIAFIYSASIHSEHAMFSEMAGKQVGWVIVGVVVFLVLMCLDYEKAGDSAWGIYIITLLLLIAVLLVGKKVNGAYRWLNFAGINVQPSELAKVSVLLVLARFLSEPTRDIRSPKTLLAALAIVILPCIFILKQPDLGTSLTMVPMMLVLLFVAGVPIRYLVILGIVGLLSLIPAWFLMSDYQHKRILVFLDPGADPMGAGWNKLNSEIAVGSGGFVGKGWLMGTHHMLGYLPKMGAPTDFIFSVIAEEKGFLGSITMLSLFAVLFLGGVRAAHHARDKMGRLLAAGVVTLMFGHVFVNIAMTFGLMPITGIPLPLVSYGGSFMICTMAAFGLVQSVYVRRERRVN